MGEGDEIAFSHRWFAPVTKYNGSGLRPQSRIPLALALSLPGEGSHRNRRELMNDESKRFFHSL
jgi:hypothetical protein